MWLILDPLPQQNPWQSSLPLVPMGVPHVYEGGLQSILDGLVSSFNGPICRCMVGRGERNLNIECLHDILKQI